VGMDRFKLSSTERMEKRKEPVDLFGSTTEQKKDLRSRHVVKTRVFLISISLAGLASERVKARLVYQLKATELVGKHRQGQLDKVKRKDTSRGSRRDILNDVKRGTLTMYYCMCKCFRIFSRGCAEVSPEHELMTCYLKLQSRGGWQFFLHVACHHEERYKHIVCSCWSEIG
jgi:hypothetical protein